MKKTTLPFDLLFLVLCFTCTSIFAQLKIENLTHYKEFDGFKVDDIISDSTGIIWIATQSGLIKFDGYEPTRFHPDHKDSTTIGTLLSQSLFEDRNGFIWIGSDRYVYRYNPVTKFFKNYKIPELRYKENPTLAHIKSDGQGRIYFGFTSPGIDNKREALVYYEEQSDEIKVFNYRDQPKINRIHDVESDSDGNIWLRSNRGLAKIDTAQQYEIVNKSGRIGGYYINGIKSDKRGLIWYTTTDFRLHHFDPKTKNLWTIPIKPFEGKKPANTRFVLEMDEDQNIWIGTSEGLVYYDRGRDEFEIFEPKNNQPPFSAPFRDLYIDGFNNLWISTANNEVYKYANRKIFNAFTSDDNDPASITSGWVQKVIELTNGNVVANTSGGPKQGMNIINFESKKLDPIFHRDILPHAKYIEIFKQRIPDVLLIKADSRFYLYHAESRKIEEVQNPGIAAPHQIYNIVPDSRGNMWYCTSNGVYLEREEYNDLKHFDATKFPKASSLTHMVTNAFESEKHGLWLVTVDGLYLLDYETNTITRHGYAPKRGEFLSQNISSFYEDENGTAWVGTWEGGLSKYNVATGKVKTYSYRDGLSSMSIQSILPDHENEVLWLGTFGGISRFDTKTETFTNYYLKDGIHGFLFSSSSYLKTSKGWFVFGGDKGVTYFHPKEFVETARPPNVFITSVKSDSTELFLGEKDKTPVQQEEIQSLSLTYEENSIAISYTGIQYDDPIKNKFSYRLENYDRQWKNVGNARTAFYQNLPAGNYTFQVKATNSNGVQSEKLASIQLYVAPPWWKTWAYSLFFLTFSGILYSIYRFQLNRRLQLEETNRLKELDNFKSKLYTNITHEFRTPLTVILGMADQVNKQPKKAVELIKRNGQNLLTLVNQMLDLSKLESGNLKLELEQKDVVSFLLYVTESFQSLGGSKGVRLVAYSEIDELVMDYDEEKLKQVISNLLTNAIKFTNENGKVILHITESSQKLQIKIQDNGIGIPPDQLPKIFDRFYQVDDSSIRKGEGTGIGLALTKELVKLMNGEISVTSQLKKGTEFKILLPIQNLAPKGISNLTPIIETTTKKEKATSRLSAKVEVNVSSRKPILLLIEDNEDVITYIQTCLEEEYEIKKAINGQLGIDQAFELIPDLIISDVMMPEKDGYEVCAVLKTDTRTSHIPIILLTAKTTEADKITGLKQGADAYLTKPFNKEELLVRLEKLLALRIQLRERYSTFVPNRNKTSEAATPESKFLNKIHQLVEENLSDDVFGIPQLCKAMGMSRSQIYRKLIALTGKSTSIYLRSIRLHKAKALLQNPQFTIAEVAYNVGYSDPAYFSRLFSKEFGVPPSDLRTK